MVDHLISQAPSRQVTSSGSFTDWSIPNQLYYICNPFQPFPLPAYHHAAVQSCGRILSSFNLNNLADTIIQFFDLSDTITLILFSFTLLCMLADSGHFVLFTATHLMCAKSKQFSSRKFLTSHFTMVFPSLPLSVANNGWYISRLEESLTPVNEWLTCVQGTHVVRVPPALTAGPLTCAVVPMALWHQIVKHPSALPPSPVVPM